MEDNVNKGGEPESKFRSRQLLTALSPLLSVFVLGLTHGFTSVIMSELTSQRAPSDGNSSGTNEFKITKHTDAYWITPGNIVLMIPSSCVSGVLMERIGRRKLLLISFPLFIIGWLVMGFANSLLCLTIGRLICSVPAGLVSPLAPVYIGEISDPGFRGVLLSMISATLAFGMLITNALSVLMRWRGNAHICAAFSLIGWLTCLACRESPIWLMNRGQPDQAAKQWVHLRGLKSLDEYRAMERTAARTGSEHGEDDGKSRFSRFVETSSSGHFLWSLAVLCMLTFAHQFAGFNAVSYLFSFAIMVAVDHRDLVLTNLILITVIFIVSVVPCFMVTKYGRVTLAMVSSVGTICTLFLASFFFLIEAQSYWLSKVSLLFYLIFQTIGLLPLFWMFVGELFPRKLRGLGAGIATGFWLTCLFADLKTTTRLLQQLHAFEILALYGIAASVWALLLYWKLPETKDKTLLEIETIFEQKSDEPDPADVEMVERDI